MSGRALYNSICLFVTLRMKPQRMSYLLEISKTCPFTFSQLHSWPHGEKDRTWRAFNPSLIHQKTASIPAIAIGRLGMQGVLNTLW